MTLCPHCQQPPIDLAAFYRAVGEALYAKFGTTRGYNEHYGLERQKDCHYAVHIAGFEVVPVGNKTSSLAGVDAPIPFTYIYSRKDAKPDLQHLIAPDIRVPNYTTSLGDALELANLVGLTTLSIPVWPVDATATFVSQILAACDAIIHQEQQ